MSTRARPPAPRLAATPPPTVAYRLPVDGRSVGWARRELRRHVRAWGIDGEPAHSAELLLSELVTNAVRAEVHGRPTVGIRFDWSGGCLRLDVQDASNELPVIGKAEEDEECGRGLWLVNALASGWGVDDLGDIGKVVWVELALPETSAVRQP